MTLLESSTLRLKWPAGHTLILALPVLLLLLGSLEAIMRLPQWQERLAAPIMGSSHYQFGQKLFLLEQMAQRDGKVDCIALGSSVVDNGFDPRQFTEAYYHETGQKINCFNFAIDAMPAVGAGAVAEILVSEYRPDILIYGTDARDYAVAKDTQDTTVILDSPWVQYRLGHFNGEGWLIQHSFLVRYWRELRWLLQLKYEDALRPLENNMTWLGHTPLYEVALNANSPPDPDDDSFQVRNMTNLFADFHLLPENLKGLQQVIDLNGETTQVFLVQMPVADGYYYFFGNGRDDYEKFAEQVQNLADQNDVPFLRTTSLELIPDDGWRDFAHVNVSGAAFFSDWLGAQVGSAYRISASDLARQ